MLFQRLLNRFKRKPDFIIGNAGDPYMFRWYLIPRNSYFNIYLHKFLRDDDDRALHDHPWRSLSVILKAGYIEHVPGKSRQIRPGAVVVRTAEHTHRVELLRDKDGSPIPAWTLFITGPKVREWGFHCPRGWVHWKEYVSVVEGGNTIGKGCD